MHKKTKGNMKAVTNFQGANLLASYAYGNDALGRRAVRNGDTFAYNARSELTNATVSADVYGYVSPGTLKPATRGQFKTSQ